MIAFHRLILLCLAGLPLALAVGVSAQQVPSRISEAARLHDDPSRDGWRSEVLGAEAEDRLKALLGALAIPERRTIPYVSQHISEAFRATALRPDRLTTLHRDASFRVQKSQGEEAWRHSGAPGLLQALDELRAPWRAADPRDIWAKVIGVESSPEGLVTRVLFHAAATIDDGTLEQNATWECRFDSGAKLRLASIRLLEYQESTFSGSTAKLFSDVTLSAFAQEPVFREQLAQGVPYWVQRTQAILGSDYFGHHGMALGDVDGDGLEDLYVAQPGGLPNRLLLQNPDGTVRDNSARAGLDWLDRTRGVLLIDLDNDGDPDLVAAMQDALLILSNDGSGRFRQQSALPVANAYSLTAADFDRDGDLDIYACRYFPEQQNERRFPQPVPHHDANNGGRNVLLRNDGRWEFSDATHETGLDVKNRRWSFAASWEDYDRDGDPDLYVANDFGRNNLYRNDGGIFTDVTTETGLLDSGFGMSASWADFNRDGWMDLYVGNMFSAAGNRIVPQDRFKPEADPRLRERYSQLVVGNTLYQNDSGKGFQERAGELGVNLGWWAWGSTFADLNNDGWQDVVVSNGYLTGSITKDL